MSTELASKATQIRQITQEGFLMEEIQRQRKQRACISWTYFAAGFLLLVAGSTASALLAQTSGQSVLVSLYDRYETTKDSAAWTLGFFGSSDLDTKFLPESVARACIQIPVSVDVPILNFSFEITTLEMTQTVVDFLQADAEQSVSLSKGRFAVLPICRDLSSELVQVENQILGLTGCSFFASRTECMSAKLEYQRLTQQKLDLSALLANCNSTEGTLSALRQRLLLPQHQQIALNYNQSMKWLSQHLSSEIPFSNLTTDYIYESLRQIDSLMESNITSLAVLTQEAVTYYGNSLRFTYLSTLKTLIDGQINRWYSLKQTQSSLHQRHSREEHYSRTRTRLGVEMNRCLEQNSDSLICRELQKSFKKVDGWITVLERFQLSVPLNFFDLAFEALLTPELVSVVSIRDFQRFKKVDEFKKNPSWSFLVLSGVVGIAAFTLAKLVLYDFLSVYLNLLILPAQLINEKLTTYTEVEKVRRFIALQDLQVKSAPLLKND